jgi:phage shock protein PspC (stress-responsive transcriptional regulator)
MVELIISLWAFFLGMTILLYLAIWSLVQHHRKEVKNHGRH